MYSRDFTNEKTAQENDYIQPQQKIPPDYSGVLYSNTVNLKPPNNSETDENEKPIDKPVHKVPDEDKTEKIENQSKGGFISSLFDNFKGKSFSTEDILLVGLIILLFNNQAEDDILIILGLLLIVGL